MRYVILLAVVASLTLAASAPSASDQATQQTNKAGDYFIGTWSCSHTFGDDGGTYTTVYEKMLGGAWIRQTYNFAPTRTEPALQGEYVFGYDAEKNRWVRFGAMSDSLYFAMTGSLTDTDWSWSYVLPVKTGPQAIYKEKSPTEYTVDGPTYPINGKVITEHHTCKKTS